MGNSSIESHQCQPELVEADIDEIEMSSPENSVNHI